MELETRNQANNQKWFEERRKRLTASNFGKICKMRPYTSCKVMVHNIIYGSVTTNATEYGKITEQMAIQTLNEYIEKPIIKCGLFVDKVVPYLAATPGNNFNILIYDELLLLLYNTKYNIKIHTFNKNLEFYLNVYIIRWVDWRRCDL